MSIKNLIASSNERLTPTERRIAEAVLDDPMLLTFGTVSGLADRVGTSRASIVRFATKLGFEGYSELQQNIRKPKSSSTSSGRVSCTDSLQNRVRDARRLRCARRCVS